LDKYLASPIVTVGVIVLLLSITVGSINATVSPDLPQCDGSYQDCVTDEGNVCEAGSTSHECECVEDKSDRPNHPSLNDNDSTGGNLKVIASVDMDDQYNQYCDRTFDVSIQGE
jgi:hypothetical protein